MIHGPAATAEAIRASELLFGGGLDGISERTFQDIVDEVPTKPLDISKLAGTGSPLLELLVQSGLCSSKGQARKDAEGGGIYLNNVRVTDPARNVTEGDLLFEKFVLLRKGKRNYAVLRKDG
jgi:tyrosyl-tRNA synthetase